MARVRLHGRSRAHQVHRPYEACAVTSGFWVDGTSKCGVLSWQCVSCATRWKLIIKAGLRFPAYDPSRRLDVQARPTLIPLSMRTSSVCPLVNLLLTRFALEKIREWARDQAHSPESSTNAADGQAQPVAPDGQAGHHDASRVGQGVVPTRANGPISKGTKETSTTGEPAKPQEASLVTRFWLSLKKSILNSWINVLLVFVPVGIAVHFVDVDPSIVFAMNAIAIIPLAG